MEPCAEGGRGFVRMIVRAGPMCRGAEVRPPEARKLPLAPDIRTLVSPPRQYFGPRPQTPDQSRLDQTRADQIRLEQTGARAERTRNRRVLLTETIGLSSPVPELLLLLPSLKGLWLLREQKSSRISPAWFRLRRCFLALISCALFSSFDAASLWLL
ncbi:hypothetical protein MPTK1_5g15650 [Marchantia polymorpha subsp. ruderalis]|uniref:Uncharacterized protein n=2 Tax=Marchantia polymorpha TaxID=3197 RepID=A0AAF6BIQ7_MARPO|nr:hypothetical protein MARPO_0071s0045 [Marchantia polymorpha]BBN11891.1 hypothetical protein Mp_5g15650 [Marchantia polymorpha subsp. ruderalis]|eukprot:PTQ35429.1 hypothetical protein MARPO_0071s0045 [Marchantia polymorpha]